MEVDGHTLYVHPLNAGQYAALLNHIEGLKKKGEGYRADFDLLRMSVRLADGTDAFATSADAEQLPPSVAGALLPVCVRINGMGQTDEKKD